MELETFFSFEGLTLGGVIGSLIAALIWMIAAAVVSLLFRWLLRWVNAVQFLSMLRRARFSFFYRYAILIAPSVVVGFFVWPLLDGTFSVGARGGFVILFVLCSILLNLVWRDWSLFRVGVCTAEQTVARGTDYESSLRLAQKSISFLGTGAFKLTNNSEFEPAVARCMSSGGAVRILMSRPDVLPLQRAEKMADVDPGDYSVKVRSTLKKLRALKRDREYPIEVRFHNRENATRMQEFRMMFVDDEYLLLSFNLYGHGDGTSFPQLVLTRSSSSRPLLSFFNPFSDSFERVWKSSGKWDFDEYL